MGWGGGEGGRRGGVGRATGTSPGPLGHPPAHWDIPRSRAHGPRISASLLIRFVVIFCWEIIVTLKAWTLDSPDKWPGDVPTGRVLFIPFKNIRKAQEKHRNSMGCMDTKHSLVVIYRHGGGSDRRMSQQAGGCPNGPGDVLLSGATGTLFLAQTMVLRRMRCVGAQQICRAERPEIG